jgi:hypothetical protein
VPGFTSLQKSIFTKVNERRANASLTRLKNTGEPDGIVKRFQYWPDTISDTKAVNWAPREIPGGSLPIYQWINSGERIISFTAIFTCDMDLVKGDEELVGRLKAIGHSDRNVDIRGAAIWLREFMLPSQGELPGNKAQIAVAPARCKLTLPKTAIGVTGGTTGGADPDSITCVMTTCDLSYDAFFPSGLPRVMTASLAFAQVPQSGSQVLFPSQEEMAADTPNVDKSFGYALEVTGTGK